MQTLDIGYISVAKQVLNIFVLSILQCSLTGLFVCCMITRKGMWTECRKSKMFLHVWLVWTNCLSFIILSVCLVSCHVALGLYHEVLKAKQAEQLSPGPGRVGTDSRTYLVHLAVPFRCNQNSFAPPLLLAPKPHVWCERMTPPLQLPSSYTPHQINSN